MKLKSRSSETMVQATFETRWEFWANEFRRARKHPWDYVKFKWQWKYWPRKKVPTFPLNIDIEVSSACNIKCDHCFRQYMDIRENGLMPWEVYTKIADECGEYRLFTLKFSMRGEPTLHPRLPEMITYARSKGVRETWINTNGGNVTPRMADALMKARPDWITMSFDGIGEMYESIRKPLKFSESLAKLKLLRAARDEYSPRTMLNAQTLWSAIKDDPDAYIAAIQPLVDRISYNVDMNFKEIMLVPDENYVCPRLWHRMAITSEGDFLKCPSDFQKEEVLANIRNTTIKDAWDRLQGEHRRLHLSGRKKDSIVCQKCHHGAKKQRRQVTVSKGEGDGFDVKYTREFAGVGLNRKEHA